MDSQITEDRKYALYVSAKNNDDIEVIKTKMSVLKEHLIKNGIAVDLEYYDRCNVFQLDKEARPGLYALMTMIIKEKISTVYIYNKDSVSPIAFDILKHICSVTRTNIVTMITPNLKSDEEVFSQFASFQMNMMKKLSAKCKKQKN